MLFMRKLTSNANKAAKLRKWDRLGNIGVRDRMTVQR